MLSGAQLSAQENTGSIIVRAGSRVHSVCFSTDGKTYSACYDNKVTVWTEGNARGKVYSAGTLPVVSGKLSRDGKWILTVSNDNTVQLRNTFNENQVVSFSGSSGKSVLDVDFLDNSFNMIVPVDGTNLTKCFYLVNTNKTSNKDFVTLNGSVYALTTSVDGKKIMASTADGGIYIYDSGTAEKLGEFTGYPNNKVKPSFSKDGRYFVAPVDSAHLAVRTVTNTSEVTITDSEEFVNSAVFSPDGKRIAAAVKTGKIRIYNVTTGKKETEFVLSDAGDVVESLAFSPAGDYILAGTSKGTLQKVVIRTKAKAEKKEKSEGGEAAPVLRKGEPNPKALFKACELWPVHDDTLDVVLGFNTLPTGYERNYNMGAAYRRYEFNPLYLAFDGTFGFGIPDENFKYKYRVGNRLLKNPVLYSLMTSGGAGGCYYFEDKHTLLFGELRGGFNLRTLCNNDVYGFVLEPPVFGVYLDFMTGVQWQHVRFDMGAELDSNLGLMFKLEIAISQKWRSRSKAQ